MSNRFYFPRGGKYMLKSIEFKNFTSFKESAYLNFEVSEHAPKTDHFIYLNGNRLSKVSVLYGANGSGKSNVLAVVSFLQDFMSYSVFSKDPFLFFEPFHSTQNKQSYFKVEFYIYKRLYIYSLKLLKNKVFFEQLEFVENRKKKTLFSRKLEADKKTYSLSAKNIDLKQSFLQQVRPDTSLISTGARFNHPDLIQIQKYWENITSKHHFPENDQNNIFDTSMFYHENINLFKKAKKLLVKADLGLSDIDIEVDIEKEAKKNIKKMQTAKKLKKKYYPFGLHKNKNKSFYLPFYMESEGTQVLYTMLSLILPALETGSPCLIDEIESSLHPEIIEIVLSLFSSKTSNPKGAQLICVTHNPLIMNQLSKYQIFLTEKTDCESKLYRLDEVENVRSDDNFFRKYLAGAYGGVPDLDY